MKEEIRQLPPFSLPTSTIQPDFQLSYPYSPIYPCPSVPSPSFPTVNEALAKANSVVPGILQMAHQLKSPEDIDPVTTSLGLSPQLFNFQMATRVTTPIGKALHVPVQISKREGGRKSLYYLNPGEEVLAGVYVIDDNIFYRFVRRMSGEVIPAQTGDCFAERIATRDGKTLVMETGRLEVLDPRLGIGLLYPEQQPSVIAARRGISIWIFWSFIKIDW
ncbi:hypothetical protein ACFQ5D_22510 [Paenibacillus farraposensis]|uniref:Uncharacterized protein n=1 Tax=Paenibacillus farraposensis TaxID=2807095 RepID=A0ABW4DH94_9BACL|nr:hypothetical protein [Paenibacillus farraposensis]MCC3381050.1 hypothetical protein [Paenibacillus farraposensis]